MEHGVKSKNAKHKGQKNIMRSAEDKSKVYSVWCKVYGSKCICSMLYALCSMRHAFYPMCSMLIFAGGKN